MKPIALHPGPPPAVGCWPWRLWFLTKGDDHPAGRDCVKCGQPIAVPRPARQGVCLYCSMDLGLIPEEDEPL